MAAGPSQAGQRHYGLRDCRVREAPLVHTPEGFEDRAFSRLRAPGLLLSFYKKTDAGENTLEVQAIPKNHLSRPTREEVEDTDLTAFGKEDARVIVELQEPVKLTRRHTALVRRVRSPVTGKWAMVAWVDASREVIRVTLLSSSQAAWAEGEDAFYEVLENTFHKFQDPPRFKVVGCETL